MAMDSELFTPTINLPIAEPVLTLLSPLDAQTRSLVERKLAATECMDHLLRAIKLVAQSEPSAQLELLLDNHAHPPTLALIARVTGDTETLVTTQETLLEQWRRVAGPRPYRHIFLMVKRKK